VGPAATQSKEVLRPATKAMGSGTNDQLACTEQEDEQGLRALVQDERGHDLRADEPPDVEKTRSRLTLLAQLLALGTQVNVLPDM